MRFGSLFAGIDGFDLGLELAGMECAWQVEIDPFCRRVLEKHWPDVPKYRDIRALDWRSVDPVELLCGGFPCQPFSSASRGRRTGQADSRYLWPAMLAAIKALGPAWVVAENVTEFDGPALEQVVSDLEANGYEVAPTLEVPACAFGFDHRRSRLWIVGYSDSNRESGRAFDAEMAGMPRCEGLPDRVGESDGLSGGLDGYRLRALGNAVVPQIVQWIGEGIMRASA